MGDGRMRVREAAQTHLRRRVQRGERVTGQACVLEHDIDACSARSSMAPCRVNAFSDIMDALLDDLIAVRARARVAPALRRD